MFIHISLNIHLIDQFPSAQTQLRDVTQFTFD